MICKHSVKGTLGTYCPLLMGQSLHPPFCDGSEEGYGKACASWELAQRSIGKKIDPPQFDSEWVKASPLHIVDYALNQKKILCVEDNPVSMKVLEKTLGPLKPKIIKAKHGQEALDHLQEHDDVGLILLDMDMPVMDGYSFVKALSDIYGDQLPYAIVLVSELNNWSQAKELIGKGVLSYVKKPYRHDEFFNTLKLALFLYHENSLLKQHK